MGSQLEAGIPKRAPSLGHCPREVSVVNCITMALPVPGPLAALTLSGHREPGAVSDLILP